MAPAQYIRSDDPPNAHHSHKTWVFVHTFPTALYLTPVLRLGAVVLDPVYHGKGSPQNRPMLRCRPGTARCGGRTWVPRGEGPAVSAARLREFIFRTILATLLSQDDNCVVEKASKAGISYFHTVFHRMSQDQYHRVVQQLTRVFIWSCRVACDPAPALVTLLGVIGGAGTYMNP